MTCILFMMTYSSLLGTPSFSHKLSVLVDENDLTHEDIRDLIVVINNGWQQEFPDYWLDLGKYGLVYRNDEEVEVRFYGRVEEKLTEGIPFSSIYEYPMPILIIKFLKTLEILVLF